MRAGVKTSTRLALIGCGAIAENYYLPALAHWPDVLQNLVCVDPQKAQAQRLAAKARCQHASDDYHAVLSAVDGAIVAAPTHVHYAIARDCLAAGVPVLCEKPLADTAERARDLVDVAARHNVPLAVNYLQRAIPVFVRVKELLDTRVLGELQTIQYYIGEAFDWPTVSGFYFTAVLSSRGILRDRGSHAIDHICWWLGRKPRLVRSQNDACGGSEAMALIDFEAGACRGQLKLSWLASFPCTYSLACERGTIEGDVYDYLNMRIRSADGKVSQVRLDSSEKTKPDVARKILGTFIEVVQRQATPIISGADVLDSMDFIDECYARAERMDMPWYQGLEVTLG
jgi:predicted dehydrogenase